jgi:hypothetical protein
MSEQAVLSEGGFTLVNLATWGIPFAGFYIAMLLRHFAFSGPASLTLLQRLAVSLPTSFILIAAFNALLSEISKPSPVSIMFVTGFIMEQGLLIDLGLSAWLKHSGGKSE